MQDCERGTITKSYKKPGYLPNQDKLLTSILLKVTQNSTVELTKPFLITSVPDVCFEFTSPASPEPPTRFRPFPHHHHHPYPSRPSTDFPHPQPEAQPERRRHPPDHCSQTESYPSLRRPAIACQPHFSPEDSASADYPLGMLGKSLRERSSRVCWKEEWCRP